MSDKSKRCPTKSRGHKLRRRPLADQTPEQRYCGTWYDCNRCGATVLVQSPALRRDLAAQAARLAADEGRAATAR